MATLAPSLLQNRSPHLRPFRPASDLRPVAELIETCFADTLDADGRRYVRQLRYIADNPALLRWRESGRQRGPVPEAGFVWEEDGRVVGNASLVPFHEGRTRRYLIANVAVLPAYRRRGIGKALTRACIGYALEHGNTPPWLHVRAENEEAIRLYRHAGFVEQARRDTWYSNGAPQEVTLLDGMELVSRKRGDWPLQRQWFEAAYPPAIQWQFPVRTAWLRPGVGGWAARLWHGIFLRQWSLHYRGRLIGVLTWQSGAGRKTALWLSLHPAYEAMSIPVLLRFAHNRIRSSSLLALDYPAGRSTEAIARSGFKLHQTLVWMRWTP